jgi:hypothetical protein
MISMALNLRQTIKKWNQGGLTILCFKGDETLKKNVRISRVNWDIAVKPSPTMALKKLRK